MRYDRILKDVVMCAQKEYLHGVGIAKVCIIIVLHVVLMSVIRCAAKTGLVLFVGTLLYWVWLHGTHALL